MAEAEASVPVASSPAATLAAVTSTSSARAMAGDSVLVPASAVVDDAGDAMLVMPLFLPCVVMADAAQTPLRSDSLILDRATLIATLLSSGRPAHPRRARRRLARDVVRRHPAAMFLVTEADAAAIRVTFEQEGELSAAIELRRRFPGIIDNARARECARSIAGWKPLPPGTGQSRSSAVTR